MKESYLLSGKLEETNDAYAIAKIAGITMCYNYSLKYKLILILSFPIFKLVHIWPDFLNGSPSGDSTFITLAPREIKIDEQYGPGKLDEKSSTVIFSIGFNISPLNKKSLFIILKY